MLDGLTKLSISAPPSSASKTSIAQLVRETVEQLAKWKGETDLANKIASQYEVFFNQNETRISENDSAMCAPVLAKCVDLVKKKAVSELKPSSLDRVLAILNIFRRLIERMGLEDDKPKRIVNLLVSTCVQLSKSSSSDLFEQFMDISMNATEACPNKEAYYWISSAFYNAGGVAMSREDFASALNHFQKSIYTFEAYLDGQDDGELKKNLPQLLKRFECVGLCSYKLRDEEVHAYIHMFIHFLTRIVISKVLRKTF